MKRVQLIIPRNGPLASIEEIHIDVTIVPLLGVHLVGGALGVPWVCDGTKFIVTRSLFWVSLAVTIVASISDASQDNASESFDRALFAGFDGFVTVGRVMEAVVDEDDPC